MKMAVTQAMTLKVSGVDVVAHEVSAVDEKQNEDDDDGEPDAVADLREDENLPERSVGKQNDAAPTTIKMV